MNERQNVSVVIPSKGGEYLEYTLKSLANQTVKPDEAILVLKDCDMRKINEICERLNLRATLEKQKNGYVTHALNVGKKIASGELIIFTDDDAILPENWIENYINLFEKSSARIGCFSSRDVYYDMTTKKVMKTPDDLYRVKLFRWFVRPILNPPHRLLEKYKLGSYISKDYKFVFGKGIPNKTCYSLPFRGVNMAFRKEAIEDIWFLEHPELKKGFRYEQHFGIQMLMKGYDSVYVPYNIVYHIMRKSLSRTDKKEETKQLKKEEGIIRQEIIKMLGEKW